ncbi:MAG: hypothetical protein OEZ34_07270 [Spirochaetia bacterium]|nr:hypothetical protein [Spirochaetia bacterium]
MKQKWTGIFLGLLISFIFILLLSPGRSLQAAGVYAEGWAIARPIKLENKGFMYRSFEGTLEWAGYDRFEKCSDESDACYTPVLKTQRFSIRTTNKRVIKYVGENLDREMMIHYKIHRVESIKLGTDFEIIDCFEIRKNLPADFTKQYIVEQTGNKRNFSVHGKFLRIERRGTTIKTYEIIYYDRKNDTVHPSSIVDKNMADLAKKTMVYDVEFNFGVSVSYVDGIRESDYDIFEINYIGKAGLNPIN